MNTKSPKIRAEVENRARKEKSNKGKNINSKLNGVSAGKTGFVSQQKLIQISGKSEKMLGAAANLRPSELPQQSIPQKNAEVDCDMGNSQSSNIFSSTDETIEEAAHKLIDINKDKLTESQLVDLISSFYLVTSQCLKKCRANSVESTECTSVESQRKENIGEGQVKFSENQNECIDNKQAPALPIRPLTLLERNRLWWMQENEFGLEETDRSSKCRATSAMNYKANGAFSLGEVDKSVPPVENYHRYQRCNYLGGLPVGEDPRTEADLRERQRRQWLAELDQQVEERRLARERERLKHLEWESTSTQIDRENSNTLAKVEPSSTASAYTDVKSVSYGRGRGLADLMGRQNLDSAIKRQQQQELKEAYAEQIREREKRRQLEREAEARAEAVAEEAIRIEVERARLRQEQEFELAQRRRQAKEEAAKQVTMTGAQEKTACKVAAVEDTGKHLQTNPGHSSRDVSHIPRPFNRPSSRQRSKADDVGKLRKAQFGSTYTILHPSGKANGEDEARSRNSVQKEAPMMIRTESSLLPSISPPSATNHPPSSDFLAAVADPDFAYPQASINSALQEVSRIKENLAQRQNELRSMQQNS